MRKIMVLTLGCLFLTSVVVLAEENKGMMMEKGMHQQMMQDDDMSKGMMMHKGMKNNMMGMSPKYRMMNQMMDKTLVPTEDGGVIVMIGNKIIKYDKDLNLIKEVEIKIDMAGMQKMMDQMKEGCPIFQKSMENNTMGDKGGTSEK